MTTTTHRIYVLNHSLFIVVSTLVVYFTISVTTAERRLPINKMEQMANQIREQTIKQVVQDPKNNNWFDREQELIELLNDMLSKNIIRKNDCKTILESILKKRHTSHDGWGAKGFINYKGGYGHRVGNIQSYQWYLLKLTNEDILNLKQTKKYNVEFLEYLAFLSETKGKIVGRNDGRICDHTNFEQFQENKKKTLEHYSINKYYIEQYILTQKNDDL